MTTLEAIAFTFCTTAAGGIGCLGLFGFAVLYRSTNIAPRCTARPPNTIYNHNAQGSSSCQYRGNPWSGWILWVLSLSYETMLKGIPGTGTRNNGLSGRNLKVNLDGIVLLRFNSLGLRISTVAAILYVGIALPFYYFSSLQACANEYRGHCLHVNQTTFDSLIEHGVITNATLSNLNSTNSTSATLVNSTISNYNALTMRSVPVLSVSRFSHFFISDDQKLYLATLYVVSFLTWIVATYACYELEREWTVIQALRRVFFLEYDHYGERNDEIKNTYFNKIKREHWIPHPELRDTVPAVSMYSLLVGNLPSLPAEGMGDVEAAVNKNINWQMEMTKSFFDHCVPNQPGFSSSIAAVTILPGADELSTAWRKWYTTAARLRRLGFIREQMETKQEWAGGDDEYDRVYEIEKKIFKDLNLGPDQLSVYRLEVAQSAAACCPHGCNEGKVKKATLEELKEEYDDVFDATEEALCDLKVAQHPASLYAPVIAHYDSRGSVFKDVSEELSGWDDLSFDPDGSFNLKPRTYSSPTWADVQEVVQQSEKYSERKRECADGSFVIPTYKEFLPQVKKWFRKFWGWTISKTKAFNPLDIAARESTYALVTFTSRQAALAARQCVVDGRGFNKWFSVEEIPVPPMADAPPCNLAACRNCCRPVTVNLNNRQKLIRKALAWVFFILLSIFYTIPLSFAANLVGPDNIEIVFNFFEGWEISNETPSRLSGLFGASIYTLFFSLCPQIFKIVANTDGTASSVSKAEKNALRYFWFFMVLTPFTNTTIFTTIINTFLSESSFIIDDGITIGTQVDNYLNAIVTTIPDVICPTWINWILMRFCLIMPLNYLLQFNSFLFDFLGWRCCARMTRGGGPGGPVPYRIYVDNGMVLLCVFSLAPFSPLIALVAVAYFMVSFPILRRNLIFIYRPRYDGGGHFWPFLFEMVMVCMIMTQILLTLMMALKKAVGPAIIAILPLIPIATFHDNLKKQFRTSFEDASLLQTSHLDGWDISAATSKEKREDFRRFLVDAHKAAYVPVCVADSLVTAEPAIVMPTKYDLGDVLANISEGDEDSDDCSTEPDANDANDVADFKLDGHVDDQEIEILAETSANSAEQTSISSKESPGTQSTPSTEPEKPGVPETKSRGIVDTTKDTDSLFSHETVRMEMRTNQVGGMMRRVISPMMDHESKVALLEHLQTNRTVRGPSRKTDKGE